MLVAGALGLGVAHSGPALCAWSPALRRALAVRDSVAGGRAVALTFDDGPHPRGTPATLKALAQHGVRATFFLVGEHVERHPDVALDIAAAGHDVGLHCYRHRSLLRLAPWQLREDLRRAESAIIAATGLTPRLYRPPYGVLTTAALLYARRHLYTTLLWARSGRDWRAGATPATIAADAAAGLRGGEVILLHDADSYSARGSWERTVAALPRIIERVRAAGLTFAAVRSCSGCSRHSGR
jgi:peptidoglycan/xylan/chitin deacetylase (PgdA/CDA1 family)